MRPSQPQASTSAMPMAPPVAPNASADNAVDHFRSMDFPPPLELIDRSSTKRRHRDRRVEKAPPSKRAKSDHSGQATGPRNDLYGRKTCVDEDDSTDSDDSSDGSTNGDDDEDEATTESDEGSTSSSSDAGEEVDDDDDRDRPDECSLDGCVAAKLLVPAGEPVARYSVLLPSASKRLSSIAKVSAPDLSVKLPGTKLKVGDVDRMGRELVGRQSAGAIGAKMYSQADIDKLDTIHAKMAKTVPFDRTGKLPEGHYGPGEHPIVYDNVHRVGHRVSSTLLRAGLRKKKFLIGFSYAVNTLHPFAAMGSEISHEARPEKLGYPKQLAHTFEILKLFAGSFPNLFRQASYLDMLSSTFVNTATCSTSVPWQLQQATLGLDRIVVMEPDYVLLGSRFALEVVCKMLCRPGTKLVDWSYHTSGFALLHIANFGFVDGQPDTTGIELTFAFGNHLCSMNHRLPRAVIENTALVWTYIFYTVQILAFTFFPKSVKPNYAQAGSDILANLGLKISLEDVIGRSYLVGRFNKGLGLHANCHVGVQFGMMRKWEKDLECVFKFDEFTESVQNFLCRMTLKSRSELQAYDGSVLHLVLSTFQNLNLGKLAKLEESRPSGSAEIAHRSTALASARASRTYVESMRKAKIDITAPDAFRRLEGLHVKAIKAAIDTDCELVRKSLNWASDDAKHVWTNHGEKLLATLKLDRVLRTGFFRKDSAILVGGKSIAHWLKNACDACREAGHTCVVTYEDALDLGLVDEQVGTSVLAMVDEVKARKKVNSNALGPASKHGRA